MGRSFRSALHRGHDAERRWVDAMRDSGLSVAHGKKLVISKNNPRTSNVETPDAVGLFAVEIKERSLTFTGPDDYPYDTVYVDDCRGLSKEPYKNLVYVYLSRPTGKWCWLCLLDRTSEWTEEVTHDRARGHDLSVLVAPKKFLRPASQLTELIFPHTYLGLVDGDTGCFLAGGGETEERERYVAQTHPDVGARAGTAAGKTSKRMG